ncbi:MAG: extracellular solute-binding protein [Chloroflexota bacterium]|nr:extracellular solute-binding protein [Chloroflexota bacterium]
MSPSRIRMASAIPLSLIFVLSACSTTPSPPGGASAGASASEGAPAPEPTGVVETRTSEPVAEGQVVTLRAWTMGPDAPSFYRRDNLVDAATALNEELAAEGSDQRVVVEASFESGGQWADYLQKVTLAAESGDAPDIVLAGHENMAPWASAGYVIALDDLLEQYPDAFADVIERLWDAMKLQGATYAVPQDTEARPMYYRKDLLAELGWSEEEIESLPDRVRSGEWTMEDLVATAQEAVEAGVVDEGMGWYHRPTKGHDHYMFYYANGGRMQDDESGKLVITRDALLKHYQLHYDAVNTWNITPKNFLGSDFRQWHETVTSGSVLFANAGTWTWAEWINTYEVPEEEQWENVGFMLIPAAEPGGEPTTLSHPLVYMVTEASENQELAFRLLAHATTPELNSRHSVESAHLAILTSQLEDPTYAQDEFLQATSYMSDYTNFIPNHPDYGAYDEVIFRFLSAVQADEMSPDEATEATIQELQAQLGDELIVE